MVFNPDRPKPREPRETSTGLMRIIGLLTAALTTDPAQAASGHESAAIRLNAKTLESDEAELRNDVQTLRKVQQLLQQAEQQQGEARLTTLVEASALLAKTVNTYDSAVEALEAIVILVVGEPEHTPAMDIALTVAIDDALREGSSTKGASLLDRCAHQLLDDMEHNHQIEQTDDFGKVFDLTSLELYENRIALFSDLRLNWSAADALTIRTYAGDLGQFYFYHSVVQNAAGASDQQIVSGHDYTKATELLRLSDQTELFRMAASNDLAYLLLDLTGKFQAALQDSEKLDILNLLVQNSRFSDRAKDAELTQTELRSQLNIFDSYLQNHDTTVYPFVQMQAILDQYVLVVK